MLALNYGRAYMSASHRRSTTGEHPPPKCEPTMSCDGVGLESTTEEKAVRARLFVPDGTRYSGARVVLKS